MSPNPRLLTVWGQRKGLADLVDRSAGSFDDVAPRESVDSPAFVDQRPLAPCIVIELVSCRMVSVSVAFDRDLAVEERKIYSSDLPSVPENGVLYDWDWKLRAAN